jgi:hypothetical protein
MDISLLKEPLGFIRFLEFVFAIAAFAACANFSTETGYHVDCKNCSNISVRQAIHYPFKLDNTPNNISGNINNSCLKSDDIKYHLADIHLDAKFFVFAGITAWLVATAYLAIYILCPHHYLGIDKKAPMADFCTTLLIAVFWLVASSAWAHGLIGLKWMTNEGWLYSSQQSPCRMTATKFVNEKIETCIWFKEGSYGGADVSILLGFLNCFLWFSNLWFIYKETKWYADRNPTYDSPEQIEI